jgi:hypothetical protein
LRQTIERADQEIVASREQLPGGSFQRIGYSGYSFKTIFGSVKVKLKRIRHKDGRSEILWASQWQTPKQVLITKELRKAVCEASVEGIAA